MCRAALGGILIRGRHPVLYRVRDEPRATAHDQLLRLECGEVGYDFMRHDCVRVFSGELLNIENCFENYVLTMLRRSCMLD